MINFDDNNTLETLSGLTFSLEQIHYDIADLRVIEHCRGADMNFSLIIILLSLPFFGIGNILSNENKRFII